MIILRHLSSRAVGTYAEYQEGRRRQGLRHNTLRMFGIRFGFAVVLLSLTVAPGWAGWAPDQAGEQLDKSGSDAPAETGSLPAKEPKRPLFDKGMEVFREAQNAPQTWKEYYWEKVAQARAEPWRETADEILINDSEVEWRRYMRALVRAPEWLDVGLAHRMRYESLNNNFRVGGDPDIDGVTTRTRFRMGIDWKIFRFFGEGQNSSSIGESGGATGTINSSLFSQDRLLQAFVDIRLDNVLGTGLRSDLHIGRMTFDFGSRRLIARNEFRNTTNSFEGVHWNLAQGQIWRTRAFLVKPVSDTFGVLQADNDTVFWGVQIEDRHESWFLTDLYYFGINSNATATIDRRNFGTYGARLFRTHAPGEFDYESETAFQVGTVGTQDLFAYFQHAELGYMFAVPWRPHVRFQYDYASGTSNPSGSSSHTFGNLFGARNFEYTPTSVFGPFFRSNISTPGTRFTVQPSDQLRLTLKYRAWYLAQSQDAWVGSGLQDSTGASGNFLGQDVEVRVDWQWDTVTFWRVGYDHLFAGSYMQNLARVPGNPPGKDVDYFYIQTELRF